MKSLMIKYSKRIISFIIMPCIILAITTPFLMSFTVNAEIAPIQDKAIKGESIGTLDEELIEHLDIGSNGSYNISKNHNNSTILTQIVGEEEALRSENSKTFRHRDGTYTASIYKEPVHYLNSIGEWVSIDNSLETNVVASNNSGYKVYSPIATSYELNLPINFNEGQNITIDKDECHIEIGIVLNEGLSENIEIINNTEKPIVIDTERASFENEKQIREYNAEWTRVNNKNSVAKYSGVFNETDLEYYISSSGLKESIIVNEPQIEYEYDFRLFLTGIDNVEENNGSILFFKNKNDEKPIFVFSSPYMVDSLGEESSSVTMKLEGEHLHISADRDWINSPEREYPVIIDPSIVVNSSSINDSFVSNALLLSDVNHGDSSSLYVGKSITGLRRTYLKFTLPPLPKNAMVVNAELNLHQNYVSNNETNDWIYAFDLSNFGNWSEYNITWENQPLSSTPNGPINSGKKLTDFQYYQSANSSDYSFNITKTVRNWYLGIDNNGFALTSSDENEYCYATFDSRESNNTSLQPTVKIEYNNYNGLEDCWDYKDYNLEQYGNVFVNCYNGALTYIHPDISMTGNLLPISINHIYNTSTEADYDTYYSNMVLGEKMHLNIMQYIEPISPLNGLYSDNYRYKYYDEDGTTHYFKVNPSDSNEIIDEYDETTSIVYANGEYVIKDIDDNKKFFNSSGKLYKLTDKYNNSQTISFSGSQITQITDPVGREVTFQYDSNNRLVSLVDSANRSVNLAYSVYSGVTCLTSISKSSGLTTGINYIRLNNNYYLSTISGTYYDSFRIAYFQDEDFLYRSVRVSSLYANSTWVRLSYLIENESGISSGNTLISESNNVDYSYMFDKYGHRICKTNSKEQCEYYHYNVPNSTNFNYNLFNTISAVSNQHTVVSNLLYNHGFEGSGYWTCLQSYNASYSVTQLKSHSGFNSLELSVSNTDGYVEVDQEISPNPGQSYTLSVDVNYYLPDDLIDEEKGVEIGFVYCVSGVWYTEKSETITNTKGWERFSCSASIGESNNSIEEAHIYILFDGGYVNYKAYVDNVQVEKNNGANYYNLIDNGDFSNAPNAPVSTSAADGVNAVGWTMTNTDPCDGVKVCGTTNSVLMVGKPTVDKSIHTRIMLNAHSGDTIVFGGKAAAYASYGNDERLFGIVLVLYEDANSLPYDLVLLPFDTLIDMEHQIKAGAHTFESDCSFIDFYFFYADQIGNVAFDNAFMYLESFGTEYDYCSNGQIYEEINDEGVKTTYTYYGGNSNIKADTKLTKITQSTNGFEKDLSKYTYTSDYKNVIKVTNNIDTDIEYVYNENGLVTKQSIKYSENGITYLSEESTTYIQNGNYIKTQTDSNGLVTTYDYDNGDNTIKGLVTSISTSDGQVITYSYDQYTDKLLSASKQNSMDGSTSTTSISYSLIDLPTGISNSGTTYSLNYMGMVKPYRLKVGNTLLENYEYTSYYAKGMHHYANGAIQYLIHDEEHRLIKERWGNSDVLEYHYDNNDRVCKVEDKVTNVDYKYEYALFGLPLRIIGSDGSKFIYEYDASGNISSFKCIVDDEVVYYGRFTYDEKGRPQDIILDINFVAALHCNYDCFNRIIGKSSGVVNTDIEYVQNEVNTGTIETGNLISRYSSSNNNNTVFCDCEIDNDASGNIVMVSDSVSNTTNNYGYDLSERLIGESMGSDVYLYSYNNGGNIISVVKNGVPLHSFAYGNSNWPDQLTAFDNKSISYDACGNPLTYDNYTYTWVRGKTLSSINGHGKTISYSYDGSGKRISKTVNGLVTEYFYAGSLLMRQKTGNSVIDFAYDSESNPIGFVYNGDKYFYVEDYLGNIIGVANESGMLVASYSYDAWGNIVSSSGTIADINPLRYRGYYFDSETGYYYLNTRYYSPEWHRFINADSTCISGEDIVQGTNMYVYCYNNPIKYYDVNGKEPVRTLYNRKKNDLFNKVSQIASGAVGLTIMTPIMNVYNNVLFDKISFIMDVSGSIVSVFTEEQNWEHWDYTQDKDLYYLHLRPYFYSNMSMLAGIGAFFLDFHRNIDRSSPNFGNYTTLPGSYQWQKLVGYTWWYDFFFGVGGPIDKRIYRFDQNGTYYALWCWKGDYWNLGAGAEIGIYYTNDFNQNKNGYFLIDENLIIHVKMNVYHLSEQITTDFVQDNWWITSFTPEHQSIESANDLTVKIDVGFIDNNYINNHYPGITDSFFNKLRTENSSSNPNAWWIPNNLIVLNTENKPGRSQYCGLHPTLCTCNNPPCRDYINGYMFQINY